MTVMTHLVTDPHSSPEPEDYEPEAPPVERHRKSRFGTAFREVAETLLLALFIYLTVRAVVQNFKVEGSSMDPTLHHGQYLLVNKAAYMSVDLEEAERVAPFLARLPDVKVHPFGLPKRGDIVVFRYPRDPSRDFIKRVVALPGETVEIKAGQVYVNNQRLEEPYIMDNPTYSRESQPVPADHYFVLGDNRNNSSDSHVWGPVPLYHVIGKAWLTYWPISAWGSIPDHAAFASR